MILSAQRRACNATVVGGGIELFVGHGQSDFPGSALRRTGTYVFQLLAFGVSSVVVAAVDSKERKTHLAMGSMTTTGRLVDGHCG